MALDPLDHLHVAVSLDGIPTAERELTGFERTLKTFGSTKFSGQLFPDIGRQVATARRDLGQFEGFARAAAREYGAAGKAFSDAMRAFSAPIADRSGQQLARQAQERAAAAKEDVASAQLEVKAAQEQVLAARIAGQGVADAEKNLLVRRRTLLQTQLAGKEAIDAGKGAAAALAQAGGLSGAAYVAGLAGTVSRGLGGIFGAGGTALGGASSTLGGAVGGVLGLPAELLGGLSGGIAKASGLLSLIPVAGPVIGLIGGALSALTGLGGVIAGLAGGALKGLGTALSAVVGGLFSFGRAVLENPLVSGILTGGISLVVEHFGALAKIAGVVGASLLGLAAKEVLTEGLAYSTTASSIQAASLYTQKGGLGPGDKSRIDQIVLSQAARTQYSNTEVGGVIDRMLRGGIPLAQITDQSVGAMLDLAAASKSPLEETSKVFDSLVNIYHHSGQQLTADANIIAAALATTQMSMTEYGDAIKTVGPLATMLGISPQDLTADFAVLAQRGVRGEQAGTAVRNMFLYANPKSPAAIEQLKALGLWVSGPELAATDEGTDENGDGFTAATPAQEQKFADQQAARQRRLNELNTQLRTQLAAKKPNAAAIQKTRDQIATLQDQMADAAAPHGKKLKQTGGMGGHPAWFDDEGNFVGNDEYIRLLATHLEGKSDEEQLRALSTVYGVRTGVQGAGNLAAAGPDALREAKARAGMSSAREATDVLMNNPASQFEILTGTIHSLAAVVFMDWLNAPLLAFLKAAIIPANKLYDFFAKPLDVKVRNAQGDVTDQLDTFGTGVEGLSRGEVVVRNLTAAVKDGDLASHFMQITRVLPDWLANNNQLMGGLRGFMRLLQLGRDTVVTFWDALRGKWGGSNDEGINPIVRLFGAFGLYFGNFWRAIGNLVTGKSDLKSTLMTLFDNLAGPDGLGAHLGVLLDQEGPKIKAAFAKVGGFLKDTALDFWDTAIKPALFGTGLPTLGGGTDTGLFGRLKGALFGTGKADANGKKDAGVFGSFRALLFGEDGKGGILGTLWTDVGVWFDRHGPEIGAKINAAFAFLTQRRAKGGTPTIGAGLTEADNGQAVKPNEAPKGLLDYVDDLLAQLSGLLDSKIGPTLDHLLTAFNAWYNDEGHQKQISDFGQAIGALLVKGVVRGIQGGASGIIGAINGPMPDTVPADSTNPADAPPGYHLAQRGGQYYWDKDKPADQSGQPGNPGGVLPGGDAATRRAFSREGFGFAGAGGGSGGGQPLVVNFNVDQLNGLDADVAGARFAEAFHARFADLIGGGGGTPSAPAPASSFSIA